MKIKQSRKTYTKEFKFEAVRLAEESSQSYLQVARDLGVSNGSLSKWRDMYSQKKEKAFKNEVNLSSEAQEVKRLKLELMKVKEERDVLKKAVAYFAKNPL